MLRDLRETLVGLREGDAFTWTGVCFVFALPLASLVALAIRRWLALFPLLLSMTLFAGWSLYYAGEWARHFVEQGRDPAPSVLILPAFILLVGWLVLALAFLRPWRWPVLSRAARTYRAALDFKPLLRGPD